MAVMLDSAWAGVTFSPPTPLDIATLEAAILSQLQAQINQIEIAHYPAEPESYRLTHRIGAALVRYDGCSYDKPMDVAAIVQTRRLRFAIRLLVRDLGWNYGGEADGTSPGAYSLMESIRAALTGFQPGGCSKAYPITERFIRRDQQGGVWIYESTYGFSTIAVEPSITDNFPLFIRGEALEEGGQTVVSVAAGQYQFPATDQIQLANGNVASVIVASTNGNRSFLLGSDYTVDNVNGIIGRVPTGAIPAGGTVTISYSYAEIISVTAAGGSAPLAPSN
jgi:hypothetical protein